VDVSLLVNLLCRKRKSRPSDCDPHHHLSTIDPIDNSGLCYDGPSGCFNASGTRARSPIIRAGPRGLIPPGLHGEELTFAAIGAPQNRGAAKRRAQSRAALRFAMEFQCAALKAPISAGASGRGQLWRLAMARTSWLMFLARSRGATSSEPHLAPPPPPSRLSAET
jgi:hypothetical protein